MTLIEGELFHDKRRNLTIYEKLPVDFILIKLRFIYKGHALAWSANELVNLRKIPFNFILTKLWWHLLKKDSSTIREWTW
jgi:hypothetical protein